MNVGLPREIFINYKPKRFALIALVYWDAVHMNIPEAGGRDEVWDRETMFSQLQSGHPAWWSAGNRCFSHTKYFDKLEANRQEEMIKTLKNNIMHLCFSCISYLSFGTEIAGGN